MTGPADVLALIRSEDLSGAAVLCRQLLEATPADHDALHVGGLVALRQGCPADAAVWLARAARARPEVSAVHANLAIARRTAGQLDGSRRALLRALALDPGRAEVVYNHANLYKAQGLSEQAQRWYRAALVLKPAQSKIHYNLGNLLHNLGHLDEGAQHLDAAWRLSGERSVDAAVNLGMVRQKQNRIDDALVWYDRALALEPENAAGHLNRSMALLVAGRLEEGWREYIWRRGVPGSPRPVADGPVWTGEPLPLGTVLLYAEQGLGDTIQFARYIPAVAERCRHVVVVVQPPLRTVIAASYPAVTVVVDGDRLPHYDARAGLMDLPGLFATGMGSIPGHVPYLRTEDLGAAPAQRPGELSVGFIWAGSAEHRNDRQRSLDVRLFRSLFDIPGVRAYSLQIGPRTGDLGQLGEGAEIADLSAGINSFADTAERLMRLDLLVSVDTSTAHLAGALGRPVWILLPFSPDWRWLLDRSDTPWYPTALLFRQDRPDDWSAPLGRLAERLLMAVSNPSYLLPKPLGARSLP